MAEPTVADLVRLAALEIPDAENRIEQMFSWHIERSLAAARGALGTAASTMLVVVLAVLRGELQVPLISLIVFVVATGTATGSAVLFSSRRFRELRDVEAIFVASLETYSHLRPVATRLYPYI